MVLGLRSKNRRPTSTQVDYTIHIKEIKPWPPSQSLKSLKSVVLQWAHGDRISGSTAAVAPSPSRIEFNESFNLQVTLIKENSGKGKGYQRSILELSLYEPRRDRSVKGQLLGNAVVDLAEHGAVKDSASFGVPLICKRSYRNTAQPVVYVKIQTVDKESSSASSSFRESLTKEESLDRDGSVSALMSEEYADEAEIASFTDDDVSSESSLGRGQHAHHRNESDAENENNGAPDLPTEPVPVTPELELTIPITNGTADDQHLSLPQPLSGELSVDAETMENGDTSLGTNGTADDDQHLSLPQSSSGELSVDGENLENGDKSLPISPLEKSDALCGQRHYLHPEVQEKALGFVAEENVAEETQQIIETPKPISTNEPESSTDDKREPESRDEPDGCTSANDVHDISVEENVEEKPRENGWEEKMEGVENCSIEIESSVDSSPDNGSIASRESLEHAPVVHHKYLQNALRRPANSDSTTPSQRLGEKGSRTLTSDRVRNMRFSMRSPPHSLGSLGSLRYANSDQYEEDVKEINISEEDAYNGSVNSFTRDRRDDKGSTTSNSSKLKHASRCNLSNVSIDKVRELELKVEMLEGELREAAAIEISLYCIASEHGSSAQKVHTPARRLSRLYIHASKQWSHERRATTARSIVSGLVLAAKACGSDVPRLTFWLSNSIVLRAIVTQAAGHSDISDNIAANSSPDGLRLIARGKYSLKWESLHRKKGLNNDYDDQDDLSAFTASLERIESWLFSRIIESIWWQTLAPHMQSTNEGGEPSKGSSTKKNFGRKLSLGDKKYDNFSIEVWKRAFSDACERLCPVRAEGHECGCLPMLARLAMEQCVARLDVAMFNAILRESDDEMPTDPLSDPISDPKVLPIPPGKSSFGAGAQLKNAIGNWSRWLTDLFGMDTDESPHDKNEQDDDRLDVVETFRSFRLLNALSDLLMLPKDMLLEKSVRKEVCPTFSASIIKQILGGFLPDEFCPDTIPDEVLEALDSEDPLEDNNVEIRQYPCNASPIVYSPLSVASVESIMGDVRSSCVLRRSGSAMVRKCHTSDDELDELGSPLASIMLEDSSSPSAQSKGGSSASVVRYQLLRDTWRNSD